MAELMLALRPHIERDGFHTDRFDAYLGDELIGTHRFRVAYASP
jgi:hypothetical protein